MKVIDDQAKGICPFCDAEKFYANVETRAWDCKKCGRQGGFTDFLTQRIEACQKILRGQPMLDLAEDRGLKPATLRRWGLGWDGVYYLVPIGGGLGPVTDIQRFKLGNKLISTAGGKKNLMMSAGAPDSVRVWLCEGYSDGGALDEVLRALKIPERVYATPGAGTFPQTMVTSFETKEVIICFDNDEAGIRGANRTAGILSGIARNIKFIRWPKGTPEGYDVRNLYEECGKDPRRAFKAIIDRLSAEPPKLPGGAKGTKAKSGPSLEGEGLSREAVVRAYKKWMHLPENQIEVLDVIFGTVLANRLDGDPLWVFLVAPSGGSKSAHLMSLSDAALIVTTTSLTPHALVSGASSPIGGDPSLIPRLNGKVLVIKDFTTILNMHYAARDEIFGVLRDAYDGRTEKFFGTGVRRVYESKFGIIAGVTPAIEAYSHMNVLGERFLKYRIRQTGDLAVGKDVIQRALSNINSETAMQQDLRAAAAAAIDRAVTKDDIPRITGSMSRRITGLAQWVAALRGMVSRERYTGEVLFKPSPEVATRLAKQLAKLAIGVALFRHEDTITEAAYQIAAHAARDTVPDRVESIISSMYGHSPKKAVSKDHVAQWTNLPPDTCRRILDDLLILRLVKKEKGFGGGGKWRLSRSLLRLMGPLEIYADRR